MAFSSASTRCNKGQAYGDDFGRSIIFERAGEWWFHDHLFPNFGGLITVKGETLEESIQKSQTPKEKFINFLTDTKFNLIKYYFKIFPKKLETKLSQTYLLQLAYEEDQLEYWLRVLGSQKAMEKILAEAGGGGVTDCHQQAHQIGKTAYNFWGPQVFREGDPSCHSGFYHGAMEAFLTTRGTDNLAEDIPELCDTFETSFGQFECLHGVGHGVLAYVNYDLPLAIKTCQDLNNGFATNSCYGGMFMENIVSAQGYGAIPGHTTDWVSKDPHFPCNAIDQNPSVQYQCYLMQTSWMLDLFEWDYSQVVTECLNAPSEYISTCFQSFGRDAAWYAYRDTGSALSLCNTVPQQYYDYCVEGAFHVIVDFWGEKLDTQALKLCQKIKDQASQRTCMSLLATRLVDVFGKDSPRIQEICSQAGEYQNICLATPIWDY